MWRSSAPGGTGACYHPATAGRPFFADGRFGERGRLLRIKLSLTSEFRRIYAGFRRLRIARLGHSLIHRLRGIGEALGRRDVERCIHHIAGRRVDVRQNGAVKLVAGNSNLVLAREIGRWLGLELTKASVRRFADNEIFVEVLENVRGSDVYVIQSTSYPTNDHLMELLIITDALRRASARRITAVIPYFGYARQDRKVGSRSPISAKLVANLITRAGTDRVLTLDLHAGQIQGFFDIPTDNLYASPVMVRDIKERFELGKLMVVSPDVGGVVRARGLPSALVRRWRLSTSAASAPANPRS